MIDFREVIDRSPDGVAVLRDRHLAYVNAAWVRSLGYGCTDDVAGDALLDHVHPSDREALSARLFSDADAPSRAVIEGPFPPSYRFLSKNGGSVSVEIVEVATVVFGGAPCVAVVSRDVENVRRAHARMLLADRMISVGTLAAGVAHEINNPLSYVIGNLSFVAEALPELVAAAPEKIRTEIKEAIEEASEGAERVRRIVRDLQTFSRVDHQSSSSIDVRRTIELAMNMAWIDIRHRAKLIKDLREVPAVEANEAKLGQVFLSLLLNAAHAIPPGNADRNQIRVSARYESRTVVVEVEDTGPGLKPEVANRVFDPFVTSGAEGIGTGLGLSIAHSVVTDLGGDIEVGRAEGRGTVFRVRLRPASFVLDAELGAERAAGQSLGVSGSVLIIDDEPLIASSLKRALRLHDITVVHSGREAIELLSKDSSFDVILCDLMMPESTGMDVYKWLSELRPGAEDRVIFMTGGTFVSATAEFLERVPNPRFEKPFDLEKVREFVREFIERGRISTLPR